MTTKRAHGIDISQWQGEFHPTPETLIDVDFAILKVTQADDFKDPGFLSKNFYESALKIPIRGAYHFYRTKTYKTSELLSESSVPKKVLKGPKRTVILPNGQNQKVPEGRIHVFDKIGPDWDAQAQFFLEAVRDKEFHFFALDIETGRDPAVYIGRNQNIFTAADVQNIKLWIEHVKSRTGKPAVLYTNQNIYNTILLPVGGHILTSLDLWLAGYPLDPRRDEDDPLALFQINHPAVKNWHFWQYSADGNNRGAEFGVTSSSIDLDVFNGPVEALREWLGLKAIDAEPAREPVIEPGEQPEEAPTDETTSPEKDETGKAAPIEPSASHDAGIETSDDLIDVPEPQDAFSVEVAANKAVLRMISSRDKAGKPIMKIREPRVRLDEGSRLLVSATRAESNKDKGDGVIHATGNQLFYFVLDHPSNDASTRSLYVREKDVKKID